MMHPSHQHHHPHHHSSPPQPHHHQTTTTTSPSRHHRASSSWPDYVNKEDQFPHLFGHLRKCLSRDLPLKHEEDDDAAGLITELPSFLSGGHSSSRSLRLPNGSVFKPQGPGWSEDLALRNLIINAGGDGMMIMADNMLSKIELEADQQLIRLSRRQKARATERRNRIALLSLQQSDFTR